MKTYIVFVYKKFIGGQENSIYKVSAASEESAVAKAKGRIFPRMMQANWWKLPSLTFAGGDDMSKVLSDFYISVANASTDNEVSQAIETFIQTVAQNTASQNPITSETAPLYAAAYHVLYESVYRMLSDEDKKAVDNLVARAVIETQCVSFGKPVDLGGTYG